MCRVEVDLPEGHFALENGAKFSSNKEISTRCLLKTIGFQHKCTRFLWSYLPLICNIEMDQT